MAPRQEGDADFAEAERTRFHKKLDGYEAMGLEVGALRQLLDDDIERFKETYLDDIKAQLGADSGAEPEGTPEEEVEEEEVVDEETADEELELQLEGAGPEEALAAIEPPAEEEEEVRISLEADEEEVPDGEDAPGEEAPEGETPEEEEPEGEAPEEEEASEEKEKEEEEIEEEAQEEVEAPEEEEPEEEAEIAIEAAAEEEPSEVPEEEAEAEPEEEEPLIVVASLVEEEEPESEVRLEGIHPEGEEEEPLPEEEEEETEEPEEAEEELEEETEEVSEEVSEEPDRPPEEPEKPVRKAKPKPKRKAPPPRRKKERIDKRIFAVLAVMILLIAILASWFLYFSNGPPVAYFDYDPPSPMAGEEVEFDAGNSYDPDGDDITRFLWDFGDGTSAKGRLITHAFIDSRSYDVQLTVEDSRGGRATTERTVTVEPLTLSMAEPMTGDIFQYDVLGNFTASNRIDGLITFERAGTEYTILEVDANIDEGTKVFEVLSKGLAIDGFMQQHDVRTEETTYDLYQLSGQLITNRAVDPFFTGTMLASVEEDVCLYWDRGIRNKVSMETSFAADPFGNLVTRDTGTFYSQLDDIADTFSLNWFLRNTTFRSDDREDHELDIGAGIYRWQAKGMERLEGRPLPALKIDITMDTETLASLKLDTFLTSVWLEQGLSQPSKSYVGVSGIQEGDRFSIELEETLKGESLGSEEASGPCGADHSYSLMNDVDFKPLDTVPDRGGTGGGFRFSPEQALDQARFDDPDLDQYLSDRPDAFMHMANYTDANGEGTWRMHFGGDTSEHYYARVEGTGPGTLTTDKSDPYITQPTLGDADELGDVATLSAAIRFFRQDSEIRGLCFVGNDPDWSNYMFNVTETVSILSLNPASLFGGSRESGYVYMLLGKSGPNRHSAALDATNGQILFSSRHYQLFTPLG